MRLILFCVVVWIVSCSTMQPSKTSMLDKIHRRNKYVSEIKYIFEQPECSRRLHSVKLAIEAQKTEINQLQISCEEIKTKIEAHGQFNPENPSDQFAESFGESYSSLRCRFHGLQKKIKELEIKLSHMMNQERKYCKMVKEHLESVNRQMIEHVERRTLEDDLADSLTREQSTSCIVSSPGSRISELWNHVKKSVIRRSSSIG